MNIVRTLFLLSCFGVMGVNAADYVRSSRYVDINIAPKAEQIDPLLVVIDFTFPDQIKLVGEALHLIVSPSGYRFNLANDDVSYILFNLPLPEVHKHLSEMTLKSAIKILAGKGFIPVIDDSLRTIRFISESDSVNSADIMAYKNEWINLHPKVSKPMPSTPPIIVNNYKNIIKYHVKNGDSISKIIIELGLKYTKSLANKIVSMNPSSFTNNDPNFLISGTTIEVPLL